MRSPREHLIQAPFEFDFFQALRILEKMNPAGKPVGRDSLPEREIIRFRSHLSLSFPPSSIYALEPSDDYRANPLMTVTFFGLYGSTGVLPTHYTQMLMDLVRDVRGPERRALRDWLDLFNHRWISLFARSWEKYRFFVAYERGEAFSRNPDPFTLALKSLVGLGTPGLSNRLQITAPHTPTTFDDPPQAKLAEIDDFALLAYAGFFVQRPRNAVNLRQMLADYFSVPVQVESYQGQWLDIPEEEQTQLGVFGHLGRNSLAGQRVWNRQSRFRLCLGPLTRTQFESLLPDPQPIPERKAFFLLCQMTRVYAGSEFDFDVQLVLKADEVPELVLGSAVPTNAGPRLGWNTWLLSTPPQSAQGDAVFASSAQTHFSL